MEDNIRKEDRLRVAAYCRVSTELEEQEGSCETQVRHYREKIGQSLDMELVGIYGDRGKSGLKASLIVVVDDGGNALTDQGIGFRVQLHLGGIGDLLDTNNDLHFSALPLSYFSFMEPEMTIFMTSLVPS